MNTNQIELFIHPSATTEASNIWIQIGLKLLDWPFLLVVMSFFFMLYFRKQLQALLNRKDISIKWGEYSIHLSDLEKKIGQELDTELDEKMESIRRELETLKGTVHGSTVSKPQGVQFANAELMGADESKDDALNRINEALKSPEFRWRTVSRLAAIAGVSELEATRLLRSIGVDFDVNKSGQPIVKLKSR